MSQRHYDWWRKKAFSDEEYQRIKRYLDEANNECLTDDQKQQIFRLLGNSPQTFLFIGSISGELRKGARSMTKSDFVSVASDISELKQIIKSSDHVLKSCKNKDWLMENVFPVTPASIAIDTESKETCSSRDLKPIDTKILIRQLEATIYNCESVILALNSDKDARSEIKYFSDRLIENYVYAFHKYPRLSRDNDNFRAFEVFYDAFGYIRSDRYKTIREARKRMAGMTLTDGAEIGKK